MTESNEYRPKCLIVEDDPIWLNALKALMESMGCDVETSLNAHSAIKLLESPKISFDILLLDWDLRSFAGSLFPSKIGADVLDSIPQDMRSSIKVVIVSGAFDDPEFQASFDQEADDIHEEMDEFQPFRKIKKKRFSQYLDSGLQPLREHFYKIGLLSRYSITRGSEKTDRKRRPNPPFRLDNIAPRFLDKDGRAFELPPKCHNVLRALFQKISESDGNPATVGGFLSYSEVAACYRGNLNDSPSDNKYLFAQQLKKHMKKRYGWDPGESLVKPNHGIGIAIGNGWDETKPIINTSEASIVRDIQIEEAERKSHRPLGAQKPPCE